MKRFTLPLTLLLPVFAAATASAQFTSIRFSAPVNPIAGLPKLLPSPMTGPLLGTGITLPSMVPALTPSLSLASVQLPAYILPASLPSRKNPLPANPSQPSRDGVVNPLRQVTPGVVIRFTGPASSTNPGAAKPDASKERHDGAFDGERLPSRPAVELPRRTPVSSGRHISLPEWDLERELGI